MKKVILTLLVVAVGLGMTSSKAFAAGNKYARDKGSTVQQDAPAPKAEKAPAAKAEDPPKESPKFPENGWHKGPYLTANVGMMQVTNDKHSVTDRKFDGTFIPSFGITFGWDIADWIGPMLQLNYATQTGTAGDPNNNAAPVTLHGVTYPTGTFPTQKAREHALDLGLYVRATLPYFTRASWQPDVVKIIPYAKLGGIANAVFVNAPKNTNKAGALGGGLGVGAGCEFFFWKGLFFAIDITEGIIFQKGFSKNITDTAGVTRKTKITKSGTQFQFNLQGLIGWHF
jgi:hypothetical protein